MTPWGMVYIKNLYIFRRLSFDEIQVLAVFVSNISRMGTT